MKIEVSIAIAIVGIVATLISLFSVMRKDNRNDGLLQGQLSNDMTYVKSGIDNIRLEQKDQAREQARIRETLINTQNEAAKALESAKLAYDHAANAHIRLDKIGGNPK